MCSRREREAGSWRDRFAPRGLERPHANCPGPAVPVPMRMPSATRLRNGSAPGVGEWACPEAAGPARRQGDANAAPSNGGQPPAEGLLARPRRGAEPYLRWGRRPRQPGRWRLRLAGGAGQRSHGTGSKSWLDLGAKLLKQNAATAAPLFAHGMRRGARSGSVRNSLRRGRGCVRQTPGRRDRPAHSVRHSISILFACAAGR